MKFHFSFPAHYPASNFFGWLPHSLDTILHLQKYVSTFHIASYSFLAFSVYFKINKNSGIKKISILGVYFDIIKVLKAMQIWSYLPKTWVEELLLQKQNCALLQLQFPALSQGPHLTVHSSSGVNHYSLSQSSGCLRKSVTHIYLLFSIVIWPIVRVSFAFNSLGILAQGIERSILLFVTEFQIPDIVK